LSPATCFRSLLAEWTDAAAAAGAEVVQWDELHLALPYRGADGEWACRCNACAAAFAERFGTPMPETATPEVEVFLDDLIQETLGWLVAGARARGLESSIVLLANESYDPAQWRAAAALDGVRYFGSTAFWLFYGILPSDVEPYIARWARRIVEATSGTEAEPMGWVQAFGVPAGRESEIERATEALVAEGVTTIAVWSYLACAAMSALAADDPDAAWGAVVRAFARHRAG
jgi:hypothetical protein